MEKKGARPRPAPEPGQLNTPRGAGRPSARPRPAAPAGSFPAPPLLCSFLHGLLRSCSALDASHRRALAFPLSWPPRFLGSALGRALPQEPGRGAGPLLASPLSLSIHCAPRATPTSSVQRAVWCLCRRRATARSLLDFALPGCRSLCSRPSLSPSVHLSSPLPFSYTQSPWAARLSRPWYFVSLLFCKGWAQLSDLCCSVWCRV